MRVIKVLAYLIFTLFLWVWWLNKAPEESGITIKADTTTINKIFQSLSQNRTQEKATPLESTRRIDSLFRDLSGKIDGLRDKMPNSFSPSSLDPLQTSIETLKKSVDSLQSKQRKKYIVFSGSNRLYSSTFYFFACPEKSQILATATMDLILIENAYKSTIFIEGLYACNANLIQSAPQPPPNLQEPFMLENFTDDLGQLNLRYKRRQGVDLLTFSGRVIGDTIVAGKLKWGRNGEEFPIELRKTN